MNYLKEGLKKTWLNIKEHKYLFFLIVFLQIVLLIALAGFTYNYQLKILENARGVIEPLEQANYMLPALKQECLLLLICSKSIRIIKR